MLAPSKYNWKKLIPYLALILVLIGVIIYFLVGGKATPAVESDESVAQLLPEIASLLMPQFDVNKIKNFDFSIFKDPRLLNFAAPPPASTDKPSKGKENPFEPPLVASSTETGGAATQP